MRQFLAHVRMKRLLTYLLVATFSFAGGICAHNLWLVHLHSTEDKTTESISVSVWELANNPARYEGKLVTVKGALHGNNGNPFLSDDICASPTTDSPATVDVEAATDLAFSPLPEWATHSSSFCGNDNYAAQVDGLAADVVMTGTFNESRLVPITMLQLTTASKRR
jgi:hypothetical protein